MGEDDRPFLSNLMGIGSGSMICIAGAGGKTSLLYHLCGELRSRGLRVMATTTTHMSIRSKPEGYDLVADGNLEEYPDKIASVTAKDVQRVARKYLNLKQHCLAVVRPKSP